MKPSDQDLVENYNNKIDVVKNQLKPYQDYYEANKDYSGNSFEKKLAIQGAKRELQIFHHKIKNFIILKKRIEKRLENS